MIKLDQHVEMNKFQYEFKEIIARNDQLKDRNNHIKYKGEKENQYHIFYDYETILNCKCYAMLITSLTI